MEEISAFSFYAFVYAPKIFENIFEFFEAIKFKTNLMMIKTTETCEVLITKMNLIEEDYRGILEEALLNYF